MSSLSSIVSWRERSEPPGELAYVTAKLWLAPLWEWSQILSWTIQLRRDLCICGVQATRSGWVPNQLQVCATKSKTNCLGSAATSGRFLSAHSMSEQALHQVQFPQPPVARISPQEKGDTFCFLGLLPLGWVDPLQLLRY